MIFPWLKGVLSYHQAPMTWVLVFLNVFFFLLIRDSFDRRGNGNFIRQGNVRLTSHLYYQFLQRENSSHLLPPSKEIHSFWRKAVGDGKFIENADKVTFAGDQVEIRKWKKELVEFREDMAKRSAHIFGLSSFRKMPLTLITYQYTHASLIHLFGNMIMLLIFAGVVELSLGGIELFALYTGSGIAGGIAFMVLGEASYTPVVGASGALSGVMSFYLLTERKKRIPYFYFVSPLPEFYGLLWMPTWMIFPLFFLPDIVSYLTNAFEGGSPVAYTAHIGGMLFGGLVGIIERKMNLK